MLNSANLSQHVKRMNRSVSLMCALSASGRVWCLCRSKLRAKITFNNSAKSCDEMNDAKLIDLVEAQPCIYDKTDLFYSNKEHVRSIWQMIAGEMKQEVPVCQKRWRYLRDYFVRQLHITENSNATDGENKPAVPPCGGKRSYWPLYNRLSFLKPFSSTRRRLKRSSTEDVASKALKVEDDINSITPSICSEGSDHTRASSDTYASGNYTDAIANLDYVKFYQAMQAAAQQNFNSSSSPQDYEGQVVPLELANTQSKRTRNKNGYIPSFQAVDYAFDEHDCFFKSLLSSVRRISDEHVIAFRTEVLQVIMKYRHLSEAMENSDANYDDVTNDEQSGDEVVVVNTEEAHWRKNLFRKQF